MRNKNVGSCRWGVNFFAPCTDRLWYTIPHEAEKPVHYETVGLCCRLPPCRIFRAGVEPPTSFTYEVSARVQWHGARMDSKCQDEHDGGNDGEVPRYGSTAFHEA